MPAKFIDNNNNSNICNICSDNIIGNNAIGLKCNPTKHIFCYECIYDWYKELKKNKYTNNYSIKNMCPICRKNGGLLPVHSKFKTINGIHDIKIDTNQVVNKPVKINIVDINPNKLPFECGVKLKTKDGYCVSYGKKMYGGFCGKHFNCTKQYTVNKPDEGIGKLSEVLISSEQSLNEIPVNLHVDIFTEKELVSSEQNLKENTKKNTLIV